MLAGTTLAAEPGVALPIPGPSPSRPESKETQSHSESPVDGAAEREIRQILELLPKDVVEELNSGKIDLNDPAFLDGLTDHVSRLSLADPRHGQRILGKIIKLKKRLRRELRTTDPEAVTSATVVRTGRRVGRNDRCPCGSGRKYKQCCLRKA